ncbi:RNA polymerase sigma factor [Loktanella agnita]|uniref:RNA polymerase sigma factor n=1 Tax=Loktanella agnita TaxID=287097 RepID=UPI003988B3F6
MIAFSSNTVLHHTSSTLEPHSGFTPLFSATCVAPTVKKVHGYAGSQFRIVLSMTITPDQFKTDMIGLLPRLRRFAISLTRSGPDADDLLQDACTTALQKWHHYDPAQPLDRWMFRVIRNLWISEIRKRKVRQGEGQIPAEEATELQTESNVDDAMTAKQVRGQVSALPDDLSQPLLLVCAEGYSYKEAAELLGIPIGTIMSRIHRARKILVARLTEAEAVTP